MTHRALPLSIVLRWRPEAARRGVSTVARGTGGFLPAYEAAGGSLGRMSPWWRSRREAFLARHLAQVKAHHEPLFDAKDRPTRRHLALIMWAYSPDPARLMRSASARLPNPRPIPLDDDAIREDVEGICDKLREWAEEEIAIRKSDGVNPDWPLQASHNAPIIHYDMKTKAVTGKRRIERIVVSVLVTERENSNRIILGGDASVWTGAKGKPVPPEGRITLRLNAKLTPGTLITATRGGYTAPAFGDILRILRHELTHVGDWGLDRGEIGYVSSAKGEIAREDWGDYYNDPLEVNAFASEVADDVRRFVNLHPDLRHPYLATAAIESSEQFQRMRPHLTPANERKVLQVAYRAVEDERVHRTRHGHFLARPPGSPGR